MILLIILFYLDMLSGGADKRIFGLITLIAVSTIKEQVK